MSVRCQCYMVEEQGGIQSVGTVSHEIGRRKCTNSILIYIHVPAHWVKTRIASVQCVSQVSMFIW